MEMFNIWYIIVASIASAIGLGAVSYGRKMQEFKFILVGISLFAVTYFITNPPLLALVSTLLTAFLFSDRIYWWYIKDKDLKS